MSGDFLPEGTLRGLPGPLPPGDVETLLKLYAGSSFASAKIATPAVPKSRPRVMVTGTTGVLGTALIAHTFWNVEGAMQTANMVQFYKNLSIMGGLFLLAVTGAGKYAVQKS